MAEHRAVVFDDDDFFRDLIARILEKHGIETTTYENPTLYFCSQPGITSCPVTEPCTDLLLTDQNMPGMTGLEFLKRVEQINCKIPDSRKAITSANWAPEDFEESRKVVSNVFHKSDSKEQIADWLAVLKARPVDKT